MLIASNYILNRMELELAPLHPWVHSFCNHYAAGDQVGCNRGVKFFVNLAFPRLYRLLQDCSFHIYILTIRSCQFIHSHTDARGRNVLSRSRLTSREQHSIASAP